MKSYHVVKYFQELQLSPFSAGLFFPVVWQSAYLVRHNVLSAQTSKLMRLSHSPGSNHLVRKLKMANVPAPRATTPGQYTPLLSSTMSMLMVLSPSLSLSVSMIVRFRPYWLHCSTEEVVNPIPSALTDKLSDFSTLSGQCVVLNALLM